MYFYIPAYLFCTLHTRSHLIRDSTVLIRFYIPHRFTFVLFYTRYIFTSSRILYLVHLLNAHTPFYIRISIYYTPPIRAVLIYSQESYTYRVLLISVDAIFIIFFFLLFPLFLFLLIYVLFSTHATQYRIFNAPPRSVKYHSDEFVGIFSDRKYHNYRGIIKNRLDQRQR